MFFFNVLVNHLKFFFNVLVNHLKAFAIVMFKIHLNVVLKMFLPRSISASGYETACIHILKAKFGSPLYEVVLTKFGFI